MEFCQDLSQLSDLQWLACYLTTPKHQQFYWSFGIVFLLLALLVPLILGLGVAGAVARQSSNPFLSGSGLLYVSLVRGVPDILFFLFVPIALDQGFELVRHMVLCPDWQEPVYAGNEFNVCREAKLPLSSASIFVHDSHNFFLALVAFAFVFGAFAANIIDGALRAIDRGQVAAGLAFGLSRRQIFWRIRFPQMWIYALPGLSNLWMILVKSTPLLFLLGVEDIVYWARELGASKSSVYQYPHPDWRLWYFTALLVFYLAMTSVSNLVFRKLTRRVSKGISVMENAHQKVALV